MLFHANCPACFFRKKQKVKKSIFFMDNLNAENGEKMES